MELKRQPFGTVNGKNTEMFTITDQKTGFSASVSDFGATLVRVRVPDKNGKVDDINFGQNSAQDYLANGGYLGAVTGRVANRISNAKFTLGGKEYNLFVNQAGKHSLHGGKEGFNVKTWDVALLSASNEEATIQFSYTSPDGEEGFPGTLQVMVTYVISPMKIAWDFAAHVVGKPTIVNITNHAYWNLDGLDATIDSQEIKLLASHYMPGDADNMVTGEVLPVKGKPVDMHAFTPFSKIFSSFGDLDNNFFIENHWQKKHVDDVVLAAEVRAPASGRFMRVFTSEPCIQLYSGNYLGGVKSFGKQCQKHGAICLETQRVPNAINNPVFAGQVILHPGSVYCHKTVHEFNVMP